MKLVLVSRSPRRREYLEAVGLKFGVVAPAIDPPPALEGRVTLAEAISFAVEAARTKGEKHAQKHPAQVVVSADTVVFADGHVYGKPSSLREARRMLRRLYSRTHLVITALALHHRGRCYTGTETTEVTFGSLTKEEEDIFIKRAEVMDKAGAYAIQGIGGVLVRRINGDFYNVVGIPLHLLDRLLKEASLPGLLHLAQQPLPRFR